MQFHEKLSFLMNITQTNNKTLSQSIHVDPSFISLIRSGKRPMPKNKLYVFNMANYFSKHIMTTYQRQALEEYIGPTNSGSENDAEYLVQAIYKWFCDTTPPPIENISSQNIPTNLHAGAEYNTSGNVHVYFENEGKRIALKHFLSYIENMTSPVTIYSSVDESYTWYYEDPDFYHYCTQKFQKIFDHGHKFVKIVSPEELERSMEANLQIWLKAYTTDNVSTYYYPRLRDSVHRATLFLVPNQIALYSHSISGEQQSSPTLLYFSKDIILYEQKIFEDYLKKCVPLINHYARSVDIAKVMQRLFIQDSAQISLGETFSWFSMPQSLFHSVSAKNTTSQTLTDICKFMDSYAVSSQFPGKYEYIDIAPLATVKEVLSHRVPIFFRNNDLGYMPDYYTPNEYIAHLENIVLLLDTMPNYHFIPANPPSSLPGYTYVKLGKMVLRANPETGLKIHEFVHLGIITYMYEYLYQIANKNGLSNRQRIRAKLVHLIEEIKNRTAKLS